MQENEKRSKKKQSGIRIDLWKSIQRRENRVKNPTRDYDKWGAHKNEVKTKYDVKGPTLCVHQPRKGWGTPRLPQFGQPANLSPPHITPHK
jgi:hypothetical protein